MNLELGLRGLHFLGLLLMFGALLAEFALLRPQLSRAEIGRIARFDALYGLSAILVVGAGLSLWLGVGKPSEFYSQNPLFLIKISLAGLAGLISLYPTVWFLQRRKGQADELLPIPNSIRYAIYAQIGIYLGLPFLASLMARGIGLG